MPLFIGNRSIYMKFTIYHITINLIQLDLIQFLEILHVLLYNIYYLYYYNLLNCIYYNNDINYSFIVFIYCNL